MNISAIIMVIICLMFVLISKTSYIVKVRQWRVHSSLIVLAISCFILWFFAAFRGDFTQDYFMYYYGFTNDLISDVPSVLENHRDFLFWLTARQFSLLINNPIGGFIIITAIMMVSYFLLIKKESVNYFLSLFLFVAVDNYVISFNLMRSCFVAGLCACCFHYIWERKMWQYLISIFILSLFHVSALVMLPVYWIVTIDFRKRKNYLILLITLVLLGIGMLGTRQVALWGQALIGMDYLSVNRYGVETGTFGSALKTMALFLILIICRNKINFDDTRERVLFNSSIICCYFQVLAINVLMVQRIAYFFSFSYILLIPLVISRISKSRMRSLYQIGLVVLLFIYVLFVQNNADYYFVWNNVKCFY